MSEPRKPTIDDVKKVFAVLDHQNLKSNRDWTLAVKQSLGDLGKEFHWGVCTSSFRPRFESEWLYDQIWYSSPFGHLKDVGLIMECEWSPHIEDIQYDFEKLLMARAPLKVMIFAASDAEMPVFFDRLDEGVRIFGPSDPAEMYVFVCWRGSEKKFEIKVWPET